MCNIYMFNHLRNKQHVKKVHLNINLIGHVIKSCKLFENGNIVKSITSCFFLLQLTGVIVCFVNIYL